ncbi:Calcipressin [Trinorchestia longiramus]|nr:Calcipressin [Trinorchestia longiramus]
MLIEDRLGNMHIDDEPNHEEASNGNATLPKGLLVTNLPSELFEDRLKQVELEAAFLAVDPNASFNYFKSFTRVRVNFSNHELASTARHLFDLTMFDGRIVRCFLTQPIVVGSGAPHLLPPKREKQFLISPPASPPVGWQPVEEGEPIINYDIVSAIAHLAPG